MEVTAPEPGRHRLSVHLEAAKGTAPFALILGPLSNWPNCNLVSGEPALQEKRQGTGTDSLLALIACQFSLSPRIASGGSEPCVLGVGWQGPLFIPTPILLLPGPAKLRL